ncbi:MAG: sensor histidine kinase, partial [Deltaproteobacteria bacterium]
QLAPSASIATLGKDRYRVVRSASMLDQAGDGALDAKAEGAPVRAERGEDAAAGSAEAGNSSGAGAEVEDPLWSHVVYLLEDEEIALAPMRAGAVVSAVVLLVAVVVGVTLAGFWSGRLTRQLSLVVSATKRLAAGETIEPIPVVSRNESGVLAAKFNEMADTLAAGRRLLEEHSARLAETNARLRELDEAKNRLLANVSHEMRTPVAAIVSAAKIINKYHDKKPEAVERFSQTILKEGRRLAHLINEALDLAKVESAKTEWHDTEVEPGAIVAAALEDLRAKAETAKVDLVSILDDGLPQLVADRDRLLQVLENVVDNGVKFTPEGGTVTVRVRDDDGQLLFEVSDTGIGIPESDRERVFERFYQVQDADPSREKPVGSGLGLTIARDIVERYGGRIWIESSPGCGTTLRFTIPLDGAARAAKREAFAAGI